MAGTKEGARKARDRTVSRHGKDFYKKIGQIGGRSSGNGGFRTNKDLAKIAGAIGGKKSRRGKATVLTEDDKSQIIKESKRPNFFMSDAARKYNVHVSTIRKVIE